MNVARALHLGRVIKYSPTGGRLSEGYELLVTNTEEETAILYSYTKSYEERMLPWIEEWERFVK